MDYALSLLGKWENNDEKDLCNAHMRNPADWGASLVKLASPRLASLALFEKELYDMFGDRDRVFKAVSKAATENTSANTSAHTSANADSKWSVASALITWEGWIYVPDVDSLRVSAGPLSRQSRIVPCAPWSWHHATFSGRIWS